MVPVEKRFMPGMAATLSTEPDAESSVAGVLDLPRKKLITM